MITPQKIIIISKPHIHTTFVEGGYRSMEICSCHIGKDHSTIPVGYKHPVDRNKEIIDLACGICIAWSRGRLEANMYERGVRDAAEVCAQDAARLKRCADRYKGDDSKVYEVKVGQYRAERLSARILALLDKEGGGDG